MVLPVWGGGGIEEVGKCAQARPHLPNKDVAILVLDEYSLTDALIVRFISCYGSDAWVHYDNILHPFAVKIVDKSLDLRDGVVDWIQSEIFVCIHVIYISPHGIQWNHVGRIV